jgi:hypothetical protein
MSDARKDVLLKALEAEVGGASVDLGTVFTDDVVGWSPYAMVSGLEALAELAALREEAFSNVVIGLRDSTRWATRLSPNGSSRPITPGRSSSMAMR